MKSAEFAGQRPFFLVFDPGDEVIRTIREFARENGIRGGRFSAIGALERAVVGFWNPELKEYERIAVDEQVEVLSLAGDIAVEDAETRVHVHVVLGRRDGSTVGGHLLDGTVFPTLEMHLVDFGTALERRKNEEIGLSLITLGS